MDYEALTSSIFHSIPQKVSLYKLTIQYIDFVDSEDRKREVIISKLPGRSYLPDYVRSNCGRLIILCSELTLDRSIFLSSIKNFNRKHSKFIVSIFYGNATSIVNYISNFFNGSASISDRAFIVGSRSSSIIYLSTQAWWSLKAAFHLLPIDQASLHSLNIHHFELINDDGSSTIISPDIVNRLATKNKIKIVLDI